MTRLYKDRDNKKLCGVCAGLADTLGIDPTLLRVIWAVISCFYGVGIVAYILCALIFPDKQNVR